MNQDVFQNLPLPEPQAICRNSDNSTDLRLLFCPCPIFCKKNSGRQPGLPAQKCAGTLFARHGVNLLFTMGRTDAANHSLPETFSFGGRILNAEWFEFSKQQLQIPEFKTGNARGTAFEKRTGLEVCF